MTGATYTASTQAATDASSVAANLASGHAVFTVPPPQNEPTLAYRPGSPEREALKASLKHLTEQKIDVPVVIGSEVISSGEKRDMRMPHAHAHLLGHYHCATRADLDKALAASAKAKPAWAAMPWQDRAAIFLKAADLLAGPYRSVLNAVTMAAQSKTAYQAEIDSACELIDFIRFNVHFMQQIYQQQPVSSPGVWNRMEYRPLEGFVLAVTPFNFTAIAGNLPMSAALMGNTVIWKPASSVVYTAWHVMKLWEMAGLPEGVITMMAGPANEIVDPLLEHPDLAGVHFTGSTAVFHHIWKRVGENIGRFRTYPRLVGETGGKDFVFAHASADPIEVATALVRGAFEFQGQKCSAASRAYIPHALWPRVREHLLSELAHVKVGDVADFRNFMGAVIDREAFQRIKGFIDFAKADDGCETIAEGTVDDSLGYFVAP
ncbi:MAG: aldehyde dehydrogenase family protein, partial [Armatimonadetes bacterium]|nr:aldehyde dehydrogenase family protein [Armatimonadota bacterium]